METPKHFDAAIILGYWPSQKGETGEFRQGLRGQLATRAAAREFQTGNVNTLVITNGQIWRENYPAVADLMKRDLINNYQIPEQNIVARGTAVSAVAEARAALKIAQDSSSGKKQIEVLGFATHHIMTPSLFRSLDHSQPITYKSVEEILRSSTHPEDEEDKQRLEWLLKTNYERNFQSYEKVQRIAVETGLAKLLDMVAKHTRKQKGRGGRLLTRYPIDVFDI
jgi:hypothetical protein